MPGRAGRRGLSNWASGKGWPHRKGRRDVTTTSELSTDFQRVCGRPATSLHCVCTVPAGATADSRRPVLLAMILTQLVAGPALGDYSAGLRWKWPRRRE